MSIKVKQALTNCFEKIENDTFDEDTIRTFLILSREYIKDDGLIKELAHFIAHPIRNKGMFHKKLNSRYTKLKLVDEQISKYDTHKIQESIKTEEELCDFMLGGISVEKISSKLFDILYVDGLDDLPETHLKKYTGFNKNQVKKVFSDYYVKKEGFYYLKVNATENLINAIRNLPKDRYNPKIELKLTEQLKQGEDLVKKIKLQIDEIQKVIRGAIYYSSVFNTAQIAEELKNVLLLLVEQFKINQKFVEITLNKTVDILLCIMTLLHDSKFIFYDKNTARAYLRLYLDRNSEKQSESDNLYNSGVIALYLTYKTNNRTTSIPLFVSDIPIRKYLSFQTFENENINSDSEEIKWITASREENKLQLT